MLTTPPDARVYAMGVGVLVAVLFAFWVFWKVGKFVLKAFVALLLLAAVVAIAGWFFLPR